MISKVNRQQAILKALKFHKLWAGHYRNVKIMAILNYNNFRVKQLAVMSSTNLTPKSNYFAATNGLKIVHTILLLSVGAYHIVRNMKIINLFTAFR